MSKSYKKIHCFIALAFVVILLSVYILLPPLRDHLLYYRTKHGNIFYEGHSFVNRLLASQQSMKNIYPRLIARHKQLIEKEIRPNAKFIISDENERLMIWNGLLLFNNQIQDEKSRYEIKEYLISHIKTPNANKGEFDNFHVSMGVVLQPISSDLKSPDSDTDSGEITVVEQVEE